MFFTSAPIVLCTAVLLLISGCAIQGEATTRPDVVSGLQPGDDIVPWNPIHVSGPNAGTNACPVCTYGARPAVVMFAKDGPVVGKLAEELDTLVVQQQSRQLKGFVIVLGGSPASLKQVAAGLNARHIGICYPDPATVTQDLKAYKINPAAEDTVMIYNNYKVTANFVDLRPDRFDQVAAAVSRLK